MGRGGTGETKGTAEDTGANGTKTLNTRGPRARILAVDDEPGIVSTVRAFLEFKGFEVETAGNGKEALGLLTGGKGFDLMILDLMMPEMGGLEVLKWVQEQGLELPIVVVTGCAALDNKIKCIRTGISDYITKPFRLERLLDSVTECLERSKDHICQAVLERTLTTVETGSSRDSPCQTAFPFQKYETAPIESSTRAEIDIRKKDSDRKVEGSNGY